jgi:hypothetical protein
MDPSIIVPNHGVEFLFSSLYTSNIYNIASIIPFLHLSPITFRQQAVQSGDQEQQTSPSTLNVSVHFIIHSFSSSAL